WIYALWQLLRCNPAILLVLSFLPFYIRQRFKKKIVIVLGETNDYSMDTWEEVKECLRDHPLKGVEVEKWTDYCCFFRYGGYCNVTHILRMAPLSKCSQEHGDIGKNIIFVERLQTVTSSVSVGKELSHPEAYEKVFFESACFSKGSAYVVPTWIDYTELSSKIWGVLSTIPILLQARNYNRLSNLLSLVIILLDFNRHRLYKIYDSSFNSITKFVKFSVFKEISDSL
ncbi:hypothetical protein KI387_008988, partial [Taxus chinensis]